MGGSGGSMPVSRGNPEWLTAAREVDRERYEANTNELLREVSAELGNRDSEAIHRHVETIKAKLQAELADTVEIQFGGSLSKHTYVDGISDVDALVLLNRSDVEGLTSRQVIEGMAEMIRERLPGVDVTTGDMAVKVRYASDGVELQLLPAIRRGGKVQVPGGKYGDWSPVAHPRGFAEELRSVNARNQLGVLPTIKVFKAIQDAKFPEGARLSGYHVEALAVDAFRDYSGPLERKAMLRHLTEHAASRVLKPVQDSTGQSEHADDYMGPSHSQHRMTAAAYLERLRSRMNAADQSGDVDAWGAMLGSE